MSPRRIKRSTDVTKAVAYLRVSTDEQQNGIAAQRRTIEQWAQANRVKVVSWHTDQGVSGAAELDKRPQFLAALDAQREHAAGLILVAKRDRLARDVVFAGMVERLAERQGARIISADGTSTEDTPEGMLTRGISDLFAQYERALIRSRTKAALTIKKARGERVGSIPYGFRLAEDSSRLEPEPTEQEVRDRIVALRKRGTPLRTIVTMLNESGAPARGKRWHLTTVVRVLATD